LGRFSLSCAEEIGACAIGGVGDPAYVLSVPVTQYRDDYIFLTPGGYRNDWVTLVAPTGTEIEFDGATVPAGDFTPVGSSGYSVAYVSTETTSGPDVARPHTVTGSAEFGVTVYGYDCDVSYAYPGGLNLSVD